MATRTIECGECGESVPYGRLSCPACGALLAAVTRASSTNGASPTATRASSSNGASAPPAVMHGSAGNGASAPAVVTHGSGSSGTSAPVSETRVSSSTPGPWRKAAGPASTPVYLIDPEPEAVEEPGPELSPTPWPPLIDPEPAGADTARRPAEPPPATSVAARSYERGSFALTEDRPRVPPPGAYLPPSSAASIALTTGVGGPAPSLGGPAVSDPMGATTATVRAALPSLDAARVGELAGWLVAAGSATAALGFVLPWSVAVIGARGYGGYLDGWGLASPTHVIASRRCC